MEFDDLPLVCYWKFTTPTKPKLVDVDDSFYLKLTIPDSWYRREYKFIGKLTVESTLNNMLKKH